MHTPATGQDTPCSDGPAPLAATDTTRQREPLKTTATGCTASLGPNMVASPTAMQNRLDAHETAWIWRIEAPGMTGVATPRHEEPLNTSLNIRVSVCARPAARHQLVLGQDTP